MTISAVYSPDQYAGNGSTTVFAVTFPFFSDDELEVIITVDATGVETVQTKTTHYTVSGGGVDLPATGSVTMVTAPASGETLTIRRVTDRLQEMDLTRGGAIPPDSLEGALDRSIMCDQEDEEAFGRCLRVPKSDDPTLDMELPSEVDRASAYLGFSADGEPIALSVPTDTALTTAWSETLLADVSAAEARATIFDGIMKTRGDLLVGDDSTPTELTDIPIGSAGQVLTVDDAGQDPEWGEAAYPPYYIQGFHMSGDNAYDVKVGIGVARCHTIPGTTNNSRNGTFTTASFEKNCTGTWAAGNGNNGLASGASTGNNKWMYVFLLTKSTSADCEIAFDENASASNIRSDGNITGAGWDRMRFIGWVQCDSSDSALNPFFYNAESGLWQYRERVKIADLTSDNNHLVNIPEGDLDLLVQLIVANGNVNNPEGALLQHPSSTDAPQNGGSSPYVSHADYRNWVLTGYDTYATSSAIGVVRANATKYIRYEFDNTQITQAQAGLIGFYVKRQDR
jgi:hypothetical protein